MALVGNPETRLTIATYALWIGEERGLVTIARVLVGDLNGMANLRQTAVDQLNHFLREHDFEAMSAVVVTKNLDEGLTVLIQGHSVNPLRPNVVMMGWPSDWERSVSFVHHLNTARLLGMSLIIVKDGSLPTGRWDRRIDIWWRGKRNGPLMVLLAHLLTLNWEWSDAKIRLLRYIEDEAGRQPAKDALKQVIDDARVDAQVDIIVSEDSFPEILKRHSGDASVVILGFNVPEENEAHGFQRHFEKMMDGLHTTLLVSSSGDVDLLA